MYRTVDRRRIDSNRVFRWHDDQWLVKALGMARACNWVMARDNNVAHILHESPSENRELQQDATCKYCSINGLATLEQSTVLV